MTLYDLLESVNDSAVITLFRAEDGCEIGTYDGKDQIDEELMDYDVSDIFVDEGKLCIEIDASAIDVLDFLEGFIIEIETEGDE